MTATGETGPWYFAWVTAADKTFSGTFARVDEWVYNVDIEQREGDNPTATLEIENPGTGLLASGELWMWISFRKANGELKPLFFGRLAAIPTDLIGTVIKIVLVARAVNQELLKLAQAQLLRISPYDDVWVDRSRQSNPDSVLEVYSSRWHFDRVDLSVSASDILEGEDGTIVFDPDDVFYDGMTQTIDSVPLTSFTIIGEAGWTQRKKGATFCSPLNIGSYTGDGIVSEWPKSFSDLGSGWKTGTSEAIDVWNVAKVGSASGGFSVQIKNKSPNDGDLVSANESWTHPSYLAASSSGEGSVGSDLKRKMIFIETRSHKAMTVGFPTFALTTNDNPNNPVSSGGPGTVEVYSGSQPSASIQKNSTMLPLWNVSTFAQFMFDQSRRRREAVIVTVTSDLQPAMAPVDQPRAKTDTLKLNAPDVGLPLYATTIVEASGNVSDGDTFEIEGTPIYTFQTTLTAGIGHVHIGATAEDSLVNLVNAINVNGVGVTGVDFSVECSPNETIFASVIDSSSILLKTIAQISEDEKILVQVISSVLKTKAPNAFSLSGTSNVVHADTITVNGVIYIFDIDITVAQNQSPGSQTIFKQVPYHVQIGDTLSGSLNNLASAINGGAGAGTAYGLGTQQNPGAEALTAETIDSIVLAVFQRYAGAIVTVSKTSASVAWSDSVSVMVPDPSSIPIVDISHGDFLPTDRGLDALESLLARARAKLRASSRAVGCSFEFLLELGLDLNCRMNATVSSPRLFGGNCMGKIVQYNLRCSGDSGEQIASMKIGSAIGKATVLDAPNVGTPLYGDDGYGDVGYQEYDGVESGIPTGDLNYSLPLADPATEFFPGIVSDSVSGTFEAQEAANLSADSNIPTTPNDVSEKQSRAQRAIEAITKVKIFRTVVLSANPIPMDNAYRIDTSVLSIPKQTDLGIP